MVIFPKKLQEKLQKRHENDSFRELPSVNKLIDFSSNDYLGFAKNEAIYADTFQRLLKKELSENGATGSRLISGNHPYYKEIESFLVQKFIYPAALVFNSGYDANVGFFSVVPQRNDIIFYDELVHASIRDGLKLGNAKSYKFKHNDLEDLASKCKSVATDTDIYVVTESVFSMDGDQPDLKSLASFCKKQGYYLVVDEAHAVGVCGENAVGLVQELGLEKEVFAQIITFGKAFGGHGAAVLGSNDLRDYLLNFAHSFIYTTGLPPHTLATILSSLEYLNSSNGKEENQKLQKNITIFKSKVASLKLESFFIESTSAIQACLVSNVNDVKVISKKLRLDGFDVKAILSPTVAEGKERLRFCIHSYNTPEEIGWVLQLLKKYM